MALDGNHHLISFSEHPLSLAGPLLCVIGLIYPDSFLTEAKDGYAMSVYSATGRADHDTIEELMEWLDEFKKTRTDQEE